MKQNSTNEPERRLVFVTARISPSLKRRLDAICERTGMKKQAIIAAGIRRVIRSMAASEARKES